MNAEPKEKCANADDAAHYFRAHSGQAAAHVTDSLWVLPLDNDRYFKGCHEVKTKVFASPALFADEVFSADYLKGAEEFIFIHFRPGSETGADAESKARARAMILEGAKRGCDLLDYIIIGKASERFKDGVFGLAYYKNTFNSDDPFPPPKRKRQ